MSPTSRGHHAQPSVQSMSCQGRRFPRRYATTSAPQPPSSVLNQARARARAPPPAPPPPQPSASQHPEAPTEREATHIERQRARVRFWTPRWLRDRPYLRSSIFAFAVTVPITGWIVMHFPFVPTRVTGPSMRPTINADCESDVDANYSPTWVLVQKWDVNVRRDLERRSRTAKATGTYARGDVVVYTPPHDPDKSAVKRVVGIAGDTVVPLAGYSGGEDPVVVPFNHLWVEGDVNDRKKSMDSNYFGPLSRALVQGKVVAMWSPWWNVFGIRSLKHKDGDWPAKKQGRVVEDAVESASAHPNTVDSVKPFEGTRGEKMLQMLRRQPLALEQRFREDEAYRLQMSDFWIRGMTIARAHPDADTKERAHEIVKELERLVGKNALKAVVSPATERKRQRGELNTSEIKDFEADIERHFGDAVAHEDQRTAEREARSTPAKAALEKMLKQKRQYGEMIDQEFEAREKRRGGVEG